MKYLSIVIVFLALICCDRRSTLSVDPEKVPALELSFNETVNEPREPESEPDTRSLIKTANYKFQVENVDAATKAIEVLAPGYEAVIADMNLVTSGSEVSNSLVIRVPSSNFEKLIEDLGKNAVFTNYKRITAQDVTEEFIDIETRLKTKKEVRDRYVDILKNKAKTVEEVLKAEEQIRYLQEEIEAKEGRLTYLKNKVSMSTINLEIYQRVAFASVPDIYEEPYLAKVKDAFSNGWTIVTMMSLFLINIWPLAVIGIAIFASRKWWRTKLVSSR
jgi:hypothetical protein